MTEELNPAVRQFYDKLHQNLEVLAIYFRAVQGNLEEEQERICQDLISQGKELGIDEVRIQGEVQREYLDPMLEED